MSDPGLRPIQIVDKNGKMTTVHKRVNNKSEAIRSVKTPDGLDRSAVLDAATIPSIPVDSESPMAVSRKMHDTIYRFANDDGSETSIAVPRGTDESERRWARDRAWSTQDSAEKARYMAIDYTISNLDALSATSAHGRAAEYAETKIGMNYPLGTIQSIYNYGQAIEDRFPNLPVEQKADALKRRIGAEITASGVRITEVPAEKIWAGYEAYAGFMEVEALGLNWS